MLCRGGGRFLGACGEQSCHIKLCFQGCSSISASAHRTHRTQQTHRAHRAQRAQRSHTHALLANNLPSAFDAPPGSCHPAALLRIGRIRKSLHQSVHFVSNVLKVLLARGSKPSLTGGAGMISSHSLSTPKRFGDKSQMMFSCLNGGLQAAGFCSCSPSCCRRSGFHLLYD